MPTLRFTGQRTGLARIRVSGHGVVEQGASVEATDAQAEAWLSIKNPAGVSDWEAAGSAPEPEKSAEPEKAADPEPAEDKPLPFTDAPESADEEEAESGK